MTKRSGYTLIELTLTMTIGSALMVLAAGLISQSMRLNSTSQQLARTQRTLDRLARDLRHDAHLAVDGENAESTRVELEIGDDEVVRYLVVDDRVRRESVRGNELTAVEEYRLPSNAECRLELLDEPRRVSLTLSSIESTGDNNSRILRRITPVLSRTITLQKVGGQP